MANAQLHEINKSRELQGWAPPELYLSARGCRNRRFHALYDRIYRPDILWRAWKEVKANKGSAGIDGITIEDIENSGPEKLLKQISKELKEKKYRPQPVKRVYIPKSNGQKRSLGKDRIVQQACKIVIEPIFEANFQDCSYGFRPKRSAAQAVQTVKENLFRNWWVVEADIKSFYSTINHEFLMMLLKKRISDKRVLKLIRKWLECGVMEDRQYEQNVDGAPQGGVISPLLTKIYVHVLDMYWETRFKHLGKLIRYAEDFVIICKVKPDSIKAKESMKIKNLVRKPRLPDFDFHSGLRLATWQNLRAFCGQIAAPYLDVLRVKIEDNNNKNHKNALRHKVKNKIKFKSNSNQNPFGMKPKITILK